VGLVWSGYKDRRSYGHGDNCDVKIRDCKFCLS